MMMKLKTKLLRRELGALLRKKVSIGRVVEWVRFCCFFDEEANIPEDVPRGHVAVYVGEDCKRYVIKVSVVNHPLFKTLLDHAEDIFGFSNASKLHIPCSERIFLSILHNAALLQH